MPSVVSNPFGAGPNPTGNCIEFCFDIGDLVISGGAGATADVTFAGGIPAGESFIFAGVTILSGTDPWSVDLTAGGATAATNFAAYINSHPYFVGNATASPAGSTVTVTWTDPGEQPNWLFNDGNLTTPLTWNNTNGSLDTFPDGTVFVYRLINEATGDTLTDLLKVDPIFNPDGTVADICIDSRWGLRHYVYTTNPSPADGIIEDTTIGLRFILKYGYRVLAGCSAVFAAMQDTIPIWVINAAMNNYDGQNSGREYGRFMYTGINEGDIRCATTRPQVMKIHNGEYDWLWVNLNLDEFFGSVTYAAVAYSFYNDNGVLFYGQNVQITAYADGTYILPAGPGNINNVLSPDVDWNNVCYYTMRVFSLRAGSPTFYTKLYTFQYDHNKTDAHTFFFLDPAGGYTRISATEKNESTVDQTYTEVCKDLACNDYQSELLTQKFQIGSVSLKRTNYEATFRNSEDMEWYLGSFKASERKLHVIKTADGTEYVRNCIIETGSLRVYVRDAILKVQFTLLEELNITYQE